MNYSKILPVFSYIFHPIFVSLYGVLYFFLVAPELISEKQMYFTLIQVSILTLFLPLALYFLLVTLGKVNSFTEATIKERRIPVAIQAILLFILISFSSAVDFLPALHFYFMGGLVGALMAFICIAFKYKASLHMIGIASLATFIYATNLYYQLPFINSVAFGIVCMGLVASSRLYMKSHTVNELLVGTLIGVLSQVYFWGYWL